MAWLPVRLTRLMAGCAVCLTAVSFCAVPVQSDPKIIEVDPSSRDPGYRSYPNAKCDPSGTRFVCKETCTKYLTRKMSAGAIFNFTVWGLGFTFKADHEDTYPFNIKYTSMREQYIQCKGVQVCPKRKPTCRSHGYGGAQGEATSVSVAALQWIIVPRTELAGGGHSDVIIVRRVGRGRRPSLLQRCSSARRLCSLYEVVLWVPIFAAFACV